MPLIGKAPFSKGKAILASWLSAMWEAIRAQRVIVEPGSGLVGVQTPDGLRMSYIPPTRTLYANITTQCPVFATTGWMPGAGTLYQVTYGPTGAAAYQSTGLTGVRIYNPGNAVIVVGRRIRVDQFMGQWHVANEFCT